MSAYPITSSSSKTQSVEWYHKKPHLLMDTIKIDKTEYKTTRIGEGYFHAIYKLLATTKDTQDEQSERILRRVKPTYKPKDRKMPTAEEILQQDIKELETAEKYGIPMPICFVRPDKYDCENLEWNGLLKCFNGGFFVMEFIPHKILKDIPVTPSENNDNSLSVNDSESDVKPVITTKDVTWRDKKAENWSELEIKIFNFVIFILNLSIKNNEDLTPDFYPRNVMYRDDGSFAVVDFYRSSPSSNLNRSIEKKIEVWSANNEEVREYIEKGLLPIEKKPQPVAEELQPPCESRVEENPAKRQRCR